MTDGLKIKITLFLLLIPTFFFLLRPGIYWNMHDDMQVIRQFEMEKCFRDGQIPCRWAPDLNAGYGYPLFNFYPPLPYFVGEIFRVAGFSIVTSIKLTAIIQILASAYAMYLLGSVFFGPMGGLISSVFYAYAPYRSVNIYVRGAMNEAWASVFFPLIFYFTHKLITSEKFSWKTFLFLSLSISGLLLSHNPMALTFIPFVGIWCLYWLIAQKNIINKIANLCLSALLGLGVTAFYTIPVLLESKFVQIETMFIGYYHYSAHFVSIYQLFISNFWGDGASVWGPNDGMSFMIGYAHWIVPLVLMIVSAFLFFRKKQQKIAALTIVLGLMGFAAIFMTHQKSWMIWEILSPIQKVQFPWRFLSHSSFLLALCAGSLGVYLKDKRWVIAIIILVTLVINWSHFTPITFGPLTDDQKLSGKAWENQTLSGNTDYLPKTAKNASMVLSQPIIENINPSGSKFEVTGLKMGTDWTLFNIELPQNATVTLSRLAYPGWKVTDFGKTINYSIEPEFGRFKIDLSAGSHQIYLKFDNTQDRTASDIVSLISIVFITLTLIFEYGRRGNHQLKK